MNLTQPPQAAGENLTDLLRNLVNFINRKALTAIMGEETIVTRGSQITITRNVRKKLGINEGDKVVLNIEGDMLMISKRDKTVFDNFEGFLPADFERILKKIRAKKGERLKRLGITQ